MSSHVETETGSTEMDLCHTDGKALLSHLNNHDETMSRKRRYLLGIATEEEKLEIQREFHSSSSSLLPESLLRKDDMFYDRVKRRVQAAYQNAAPNLINRPAVLLPTISRLLASVDKMTNEGLYCLAVVLADEGSSSLHGFENTRTSMTKFIKNYLSNVSAERHLKLCAPLSQIVNDPCFYFPHECPTALARTAAIEIIRELEVLDTQTLMAMRRKLRGVRGSIPQTHRKKGLGKRIPVINEVRQTCERMILESGKHEELQEPLAKAMSVAGLSLMLQRGFYDPYVAIFHHFSPEILSLQKEIAKAFWLMKDKVGTHELKDLHLRLDPAAKDANVSLRIAIKKLLAEYLFDCDEMDTIPKSLSESLAIINKTSRTVPNGLFPDDHIKEEVEFILNLSAQIKQVSLDSLPDINFGEDYADAHMEDLEDSEDEGCEEDEDAKLQQLLLEYSQTHISRTGDSQSEGVGESNGITSKPSSSVTQGTGFISPSKNALREESKSDVMMDSTNWPAPSVLSEQEKLVAGKHSTSNNKFLAVQEICDDTSMVAYDLIGALMVKFARQGGIKLDKVDEIYLKGNSLIPEQPQAAKGKYDSGMQDVDRSSSIVRVIEEQIPQIGKEALEKLRRLLS